MNLQGSDIVRSRRPAGTGILRPAPISARAASLLSLKCRANQGPHDLGQLPLTGPREMNGVERGALFRESRPSAPLGDRRVDPVGKPPQCQQVAPIASSVPWSKEATCASFQASRRPRCDKTDQSGRIDCIDWAGRVEIKASARQRRNAAACGRSGGGRLLRQQRRLARRTTIGQRRAFRWSHPQEGRA